MTVEPLDPEVLQRERYADAEQLLVDWLEQALAALHLQARTRMPKGDDLQALLAQEDVAGLIHVEVFDGDDLNAAQERINTDVDLYVPELADGNPDDAGANDLAALIRSAMLYHLPGYYATMPDGSTATVQEVVTFSRPTARPYDDNSAICRRHAAYQVTIATRG
jgi:hypothetical protein